MSAPVNRFQVYPKQQQFLQSDALVRAFVGGIGCGKSRVGAIDLIHRAKPGRTYLVTAPTYVMLSDATMRSVEAVALELGAVETGAIKRSPPPEMRLKNGAEILFRSGDDPERLRGPNLSGIWMDEASLMPREVYDILIGRLREGGEMGWLSATFTPKGRLHWTYEEFATGKPDTFGVHARTWENPFLPPAFYEKVKARYTSMVAAQELEGEFIDAGGAMFRRKWFGTPIELAAVPPLVTRVRAWDLAATPQDEKKARDPDYTAGVLMGRDRADILYLLDVRRDRRTPQGVQEWVAATAQADGRGTPIYMEQEPGSAGKSMIDHYQRHVLQGYNFAGEKSTGDKATRAKPLAAQAEAGAVKLVQGYWNTEFLDECEMFPLGKHDDMVDAAALACWHAANRALSAGWKSPKQLQDTLKDQRKTGNGPDLLELCRRWGMRHT